MSQSSFLIYGVSVIIIVWCFGHDTLPEGFVSVVTQNIVLVH